MVLGSDPSVCKGGTVSVMPSVERVCAELIRREAAGSGRHIKDVMGAVADLVKAASVPVRKKEAHTAAKLGSKVVHSEQGQSSQPLELHAARDFGCHERERQRRRASRRQLSRSAWILTMRSVL